VWSVKLLLFPLLKPGEEGGTLPLFDLPDDHLINPQNLCRRMASLHRFFFLSAIQWFYR